MGNKVVLKDGRTVNVEIDYVPKTITAHHKGQEIQVEKRTTKIKIEEVGEQNKLLAEQTVSCSHKDEFVRVNGRREVLKHLFNSDVGKNGFLADRENRRRIAAAVHVGQVRSKEKKKKEKAAKA